MTRFFVFLGSSVLLLACTGPARTVQAVRPEGSRPNVLFIVADDMNSYSLLKNYPVLKTPSIDRLTSQSLYFMNATCAAPVCIPSRVAFFSGISPHKTGAYFNKTNVWTSPEMMATETLPETFKKSGYTTWGRGKIFHVALPGDREQQMFDNKVAKGGFGPFGDKKNRYSGARWMTIQPWEGPDSDFPDVRNADAAIEFLSQPHDKPFFMYYGMFRPHSPYTAPKRFFDLYSDVKFTPPPGYLENDLDDVPERGRNLVDSMKNYRKEGLNKQQVWMELMKAYCANTSFADWNIGRILDALDKSGFAKNTIVIFVSDNGFHNGTKEHWAKSTLWDQADVVPFLVRLPGGKTFRCPQTVNLMDIYPTLVEYCGLQSPGHELDGKSMMPLFRDPSSAWKRNSLTFYGANYSGVRDENYRYIRYPDGSEELYDHRTDPYEHKNLAGDVSLKAVKEKLAASIPSNFKISAGGGPQIDDEE